MSHPQLINSASGRFYICGKTSGKKQVEIKKVNQRKVEKINSRGYLKGNYTIGYIHRPAKTYNA